MIFLGKIRSILRSRLKRINSTGIVAFVFNKILGKPWKSVVNWRLIKRIKGSPGRFEERNTDE